MAQRIPLLCLVAACATVIGVGVAAGQALPDLSGTYRCVPDSKPCQSATYSVKQSGGGNLDVKGEHGEEGSGTVTSAISVSLGPPWNMLGTMPSDHRTIEWAAGTRWQKQ